MKRSSRLIFLSLVAAALAGCSSVPGPSRDVARASPSSPSSTSLPSSQQRGDSIAIPAAHIRIIDRITWGANPSTLRAVASVGFDDYLRAQLRGTQSPDLPREIEAQIAALTIEQVPVEQLVIDANRRRLGADAVKDDTERDKARSAYQRELQKLGREAMTRTLLRAVYSSNQLREQLTWFWFDHFNVNQNKNVIRALIGDYEDRAIRRHALGKFRDMLGAVARHPAMLIYLDNAQNASGRINENFARELMELHTLGVDGGYTQADVQELARVLTGVGVNLRGQGEMPRVRRDVRDDYLRIGAFEFNPNRHDYGTKALLGRPLEARGLAELDEALDRLARHPSTARFVSRKLATYFVSDTPSQALVDAMAARFARTDGDIAAVVGTMLETPEFSASLGRKFKDPVHYVVSSVRLAYDSPDSADNSDEGGAAIVNALPMIMWLNRMGQPLFGRQTPDGYPATADAWTSPAQMTTRFEIARAIVAGGGRMFRNETPDAAPVSAMPVTRRATPQPLLDNAVYRASLQPRLSAGTRTVLDEASSRNEWSVLLLASPEFQQR